MKSIKKLVAISFLLLAFASCKKESTPANIFSYEGVWTVYYNYTTGAKPKGSFTANLKSNGKWDYNENNTTVNDAGTWTSSGNNVTFSFSIAGLAVYTGTKTSDVSIKGTQTADAGVSTGTFAAIR